MLPNDYKGWAMEIKTMGDVGALVRSVRTARGMTQAELAAQLRVSRDWVVRLEKGHPRLEAQRVLDALRVVGVNLDAAVREKSPGKPREGAAPETSANAATPTDPFDSLFGTKP